MYRVPVEGTKARIQATNNGSKGKICRGEVGVDRYVDAGMCALSFPDLTLVLQVPWSYLC
jgi:hypothetical protein